MVRFWAAVELLSGQSAAIVELTNVTTGDWAGCFRVDLRSGSAADLREEAYRQASMSAAAKGGMLDRFVEGCAR